MSMPGMRIWLFSGCCAVALLISDAGDAAAPESMQSEAQLASFSGEKIIRESLKRHELYPYVYEEQTLVLMDSQAQHDVRRIHRYSRLEKSGVFHSLLEFVYPESIAGTALLFVRYADDRRSSRIFLPALGARMVDYVGAGSGGQLLGSEFSLSDLMPEDVHAFIYQRKEDVVDDGVAYFLVLAQSRANRIAQNSAYYERRLFVRQDNFFVTRIDYFDSRGHLLKQQMRHDIHQVGGAMWRADMISVENMLNKHRSILKIDKRVYARDYVPESIFSEARILAAAAPVSDMNADELTAPVLATDTEKTDAREMP